MKLSGSKKIAYKKWISLIEFFDVFRIVCIYASRSLIECVSLSSLKDLFKYLTFSYVGFLEDLIYSISMHFMR